MSSPTDVNLVKLAPRAQAVRTLRLWIQQGILPGGERLPAEQPLADKLGVSRATLRAALEELDAQGLLKPHAGRGRIVVGMDTSGHSVLADTVAILTDAPNQILADWQHQQGWSGVIQLGAMEAIGKAGLHALTLHPDRLGEDRLRQFIAEKLVGVIALRRQTSSSANLRTLVALRGAGVPVVVYGDLLEAENFDSVSSDHEAGSYDLTRWLIAQGRQRILRVWSIPWDAAGRPAWLAGRDAGYERAMREAGLEILSPLEFRGAPIETNRTAAEFELSTRLRAGYLWPYLSGDTPVDALMVTSDGGLYATAAACRLSGRLPGRDVLLAGYDNYWADSLERQWEASVPAVTVDKLNMDMGRAMVDLLMARRQGPPDAPPNHRTIAPKLVVVGAAQGDTPTAPALLREQKQDQR